MSSDFVKFTRQQNLKKLLKTVFLNGWVLTLLVLAFVGGSVELGIRTDGYSTIIEVVLVVWFVCGSFIHQGLRRYRR